MLRLLKQIPRYFLRKCGYNIVRVTENKDVVALRRAHILQAHDIDVALDIGASVGTYAQKLRKGGYQGRIISFEPLSSSFELLRHQAEADPLWQVENTAVGDSDGEVEINISERITSSSILPMLSCHVAASPDSEYVSRQTVRLVQLDSLLDNYIGEGSRIYVKMDVQGYEKSVLQGAVETLKRTEAIEIELSLVPLYQGSTLYDQMINYLENLGFGMVSWEDVFIDPQTAYVLQADAIFVRH